MYIDLEVGEILLVDKPLEWTSFDVVNKIRNAVQKKKNLRNVKVGHAGTLDPLATGLLIVCVGKMTKQIDGFMGLPKTYTGAFTLGAATPSFDRETEIDQIFPIHHITPLVLEQARQKFLGTIDQTPPMYSAIKKDGVRLYEAARKNQTIEIPSRAVQIFDFKINQPMPPAPNQPFLEIDFEITCSKGTYIRSIANDFGKACDSGAYLNALVRTAIGDYKLLDAWNLENLIAKINEI